MNNFSYLKKYLRKNHYYDLEEEILVQLESHPNFPSLYAIVDTFSVLEIENIAIKTEKDEFDNLPENFIAVVNSDTGKETVFTEKSGDKIRIEFSNGFKKTISKSEFFDIWTGIIVAIEKKENDRKINFSGKYNEIVALLFCLSILVIILKNKEHLILASGYYLSVIIGLIISVFLIREEIGIHNESISKICNVNEKTSCKEVLSSKGAKIKGEISLSDISLVYFLSISVLNLFSAFENNLNSYACLAFLSIPIVFYSVFYQYFVLKKWCVLCLGIVSVLLFQAVLVLYSTSGTENLVSIFDLIFFVFLMSTILVIWLKFKTLFKNNNELKRKEIKYNQLKRNEVVFNALLQKSRQIETTNLDEIKTFTLGQYDAPLTLYAILSASCGHCHSAYENIVKLIGKNPDEIKAKIIFNVNIENENNPTNKVYHLATLFYFNDEEEKAKEALEDWHIKKMTLEKWSAKWGTTDDLFSKAIIAEQYNWCYSNDLLFTPAIVINGSLLSKEYQIIELNYFFESLIENKNVSL